MKTRLGLILAAILLAGLAACKQTETQTTQVAPDPCAGINVLSDAEKQAGWELLFDGKSITGWHGYNGGNTASFKIEDCALKTVGTEGNYGSDLRADLVTDKEYENFELSIDWKASKGGNSGVMYAVIEDPKYKAAWMTGPEYQFIDDIGFPEKLEEWQKAGANYAMHLPNDQKELKPVGEWNTTKILANGNHVEHWLNGKKILEFERWNDEWNKLRNSGKWKEAPDYGLARKGKLAIQDHGSLFWFRNVKIREIK